MPHRDPETGQFTNDVEIEHYDDYVFQHVHSRYTVGAANLPGAFPINASDIRTIGLDDLLDRNERADLVAVNIESLQASVPGTSSAESALQARWELHAGVGDELILDADSDRTGGLGPGGDVTLDAWQSDSPDVLFSASWIAEGGFADSTNGLGGGPDQPVIDSTTHFPRDYGSCPEFDDRDDITESLFLNDAGSADISDSLIIMEATYTLVFRVHERD